MKWRLFLFSQVFITVVITGCKNQISKHPLSGDITRPNIIFFLTDDQRWDAMGCAGNAYIQTPNMDKLAARGIMFSKAYVTTPICAISRASILSGQYLYDSAYIDLYKNREFPMSVAANSFYWNAFSESFRKNNEGRIRWKIRFETPEKYQTSIAGYYRLIYWHMAVGVLA